MRLNDFQKQILINECIYSSSRSSGPGGQNVNKVNTKIQLHFNINDSTLFNPEQKATLHIKLKTRINNDGYLHLSIQETRSQLKNKQIAIESLFVFIEKALTQPKKRRKTKPTKASKMRRLDDKKKLGSKKKDRQRPTL